MGVVALCNVGASAQTPLQIGGGSIASFPPTYKAKTTESNEGFNATQMLSRKIYADELPSFNDGGLEVPGRCLPTNDWWTDIINSQFSGALWSYPAMLSTSETGVKVNWPSYWADAGKEIKSNSNLTVSAKDYQASATIAKDWHDWDVVFRMPDKSGNGEITVTSMHGSPFTWFEFNGLTPRIDFSASAEILSPTEEYLCVKIGSDLYGIYFPAGSTWNLSDNRLTFDSEIEWISVALLRSEQDLAAFASYAVSVPRSTRVDWTYDETSAKVNIEWSVSAENLRDKGSSAPVMMGFLPHAYKYILTGHTLTFTDDTGFMTPRGKLKLATSPSGVFSYSYQFSGMLPIYGAPDVKEDDAFSDEILNTLITDYANGGTFGGDTYWGGKGLVQMAMNMWFAKQSGNAEVYESSKQKLRDSFENWLTYTPGENTFFFSYYPRWGGMLGFDVSYDSDAFNDHHFHYGYFTYAAALLCMEDTEFAEKYGEILTMIAKDYANWDRNDVRFPFMRTLDIWNGHSWAGGLGDHGNDNGNGQESTSEAMQSWGGLYLLGVALNDKPMRDAGIWGWSTEARATREYWFDVDAPRPANAGGRKPWPGKGDRQGNYNYDEYPYAYNSNITGKGIGWWTWFGGDPLFMHGIQWMPISPALDYLSWDPDFVQWAIDDMLEGANSSFSHKWFEDTFNSDNGERIEPLAYNDWGNVSLAYLQRCDPHQAAEIFNEAWNKKLHIATSISTSHISYYIIHSHLTYGEQDFSCHADIPTAQVFVKNGVPTYFVYNPDNEDREVNFYDESGKLLKSVTAPARKLAGISADPKVSDIEYKIEGGTIIPPGESAGITARVLDQYGAGMKAEKVLYSLSQGAPASLSGNTLVVNADAPLSTVFTLTLSCGDIVRQTQITVNQRPKGSQAELNGIPQYLEKGTTLSPEFLVTDQYGNVSTPADTKWQITDASAQAYKVRLPIEFPKAGKYTVTASSESLGIQSYAETIVTPPLPLISVNADVAASSAENVGTLPRGVNDSDTSSRWGSAHNDNEWVMIDLGEDCFISRVSILWEAAFATHYELQCAPDGCDMMNMDVDYAGQQNTITVPVESAWMTVADVFNSSAGEKTDNVNATGRYIRMKGLSRSTPYGYSIYEMGVFGMRLSADPTDILGIDFSLPAAMDCNESHTIEPEIYTYGGSLATLAEIEWKSNLDARFDGNVYTPLAPGMHTVTASLPGNIISEAKVFVNDVERPVAVEFERDSYTMVEGDVIEVPFTVTSQFMAPYKGDIDFLEIHVTDAEGKENLNASYNASEMLFTSSVSGDYYIVFGQLGSVHVAVRELSQVNLALDKPATASSSNGANTAAKAVDGDVNSRWESAWEDNQTLEVDLGDFYLIDRVRIIWEGAYAREYSLMVSGDGESWYEFFARNDSEGGTEDLTFDAVPARYVRLNCITRALSAYGFSVKELEIYGVSKLDENSSAAPTITGLDIATQNGAIIAESVAIHDSGTVLLTMSVYDEAGTLLNTKGGVAQSGQEWNARFDSLTTGTYSLCLTASDIFGNETSEWKKNINVVYSIVGINLALGKEAKASSAENPGLEASYAVDGDLDTRWGSQFNDNEWIIVDLGRFYYLTDVYIHWNQPAYATDFSVAVSKTGDTDDFTELHYREGYSHTGEKYILTFDKETEGRYVKITGHKRATGYGTSINEIEVYGSGISTGVDTLGEDDAEAEYFNLQGMRVAKPEPGQMLIVKKGSTSVKRVF